MTLCLLQTSEKTEKGNDLQSIEILKYIIVDVDVPLATAHDLQRLLGRGSPGYKHFSSRVNHQNCLPCT
jgi:hypothetical protein